MKPNAFVLSAVVALAALPAFAQDTPEVADTDGNGTWSLTELQATYPAMTAETFATVDANTDGAVDTAELSAALGAGTVAPAGG